MRGGREFGDNSLRPRITPKLNLSATSLTTLISWEGNVQEPSFTCSLSTSEILGFEQTPYIPPKFSCHSQSTERFYSFFIPFTSLNVFLGAVKLVTESAAAVAGQEARDGFIRAMIHHWNDMPQFRTKADIMATF